MCREGSIHGCGIRVSQSAKGSDSWVDDPITRHIIGVYISKEEGGDGNNDINNLLWPLVLHTKGHFCILILPLVEPRHVKAYARLCNRSDCGNAVGVEDSISSILLDLPSITGYGKLIIVFLHKNNSIIFLKYCSYFSPPCFKFSFCFGAPYTDIKLILKTVC